MPKLKRRQFLTGVAGTVATGSISGTAGASFAPVGSTSGAYQTFTQAEAATYATWCDHLAIGAAGAGVASFVDASISGPYEESRLLLRFFVNPSLGGFYTAGIQAIDQESDARFGRAFVALDAEQQRSIVAAASQATTEVWSKPDASFFYLISRSDAVDVVYGTDRGFDDLGLPSLAHIPPPSPW